MSNVITLSDGSRMVWKDQIVDAVKDDGPGKLVFLVSTESVDSDGDIIHQQATDKGRGWMTDAFNKSPLMLWQHDRSMPNIAAETTRAVVAPEGLTLNPAEFDMPDPAAAFVEGKIRRGVIKQFSVGVRYMKFVEMERRGLESFEHELIEVSPVNRGANFDTAVLAKSALMFRPDLAQKLEDAGDPEMIELKAEMEELRGRLVTAENIISRIGAEIAARTVEQKSASLSAWDEAALDVLNRMKAIGTAS